MDAEGCKVLVIIKGTDSLYLKILLIFYVLKMRNVFFFIVVVILSVVTFYNNIVWLDDISLWLNVVKKSPLMARAYHNLGVAYLRKKYSDKAIINLEKALTLDPNYADTHYNLGLAYGDKGFAQKAYDEMKKANELVSGNIVDER